MNSLSIFTSMTNPEARNDPWKEALSCYESLADEVVIVGKDWPYDFSWDFIGKTFQKGFDECNSDWVIRMDIDYFFHENDFYKIRNALEKYKEYPNSRPYGAIKNFHPPLPKLDKLDIKFYRYDKKNQHTLYNFNGRDHMLVFSITTLL